MWRHKERWRRPISNVHARKNLHIFHWTILMQRWVRVKPLKKYLPSHVKNCKVCNFILLCALQRRKKIRVSSLGEVLCGEWMRQHNLATCSIWVLQPSQQRALLIYGQNFWCIVLVYRWSVFSYVAQFSSLQQTGTELFILSHKRAEWYVRYLIRY